MANANLHPLKLPDTPMKTARILSRSIATFLALAPLGARAASDTLNGTSWQTPSQWSLGHFPGVTENAIIAVASLTPSIVNVFNTIKYLF